MHRRCRGDAETTQKRRRARIGRPESGPPPGRGFFPDRPEETLPGWPMARGRRRRSAEAGPGAGASGGLERKSHWEKFFPDSVLFAGAMGKRAPARNASRGPGGLWVVVPENRKPVAGAGASRRASRPLSRTPVGGATDVGRAWRQRGAVCAFGRAAPEVSHGVRDRFAARFCGQRREKRREKRAGGPARRRVLGLAGSENPGLGAVFSGARARNASSAARGRAGPGRSCTAGGWPAPRRRR